ncbi:ComF family protein [Streptomyces sp. NBC_00654]|uniref:ComF family protein n=1 Tax=Streptomyces sp. NBC_00654 TaxID=2975799 RepID=UPI002258ED02|nr:ComF family protein [Streptomyces sp. NBC_00654]MCX4969728.1 ComF family protein [Streptomyces sp. NBC_00654]
MREWWREITGLVLPVACAGCGLPRTELCRPCAAALDGALPRRVRPSPEPAGLPVVRAAAPYENAVRAVLLAHKERGALGLAGALGRALAGAVRAGEGRLGDGGPLLLVPVPSARRSTGARGHDPVRRIALAAAGELRRDGVPARVLAALRQRRPVADQAGLGARQRQANLAGALEVVPGGGRLLAGGRVVLVDDLMTTGATLAEAARAVRSVLDSPPASPPASPRAFPPAFPRVTPGAASRAIEPAAARRGTGPGALCAAVVSASPAAFEINWNC